MDDSIIPYPVRSYLAFRNKKCRIYTIWGVLQTPNAMEKLKGEIYMEKILKNISWILVVLLAASIIYALLAGQYPITSLGVAAVLLIVTAVRAVFGSLKKADE